MQVGLLVPTAHFVAIKEENKVKVKVSINYSPRSTYASSRGITLGINKIVSEERESKNNVGEQDQPI